MSNSLFTCPCCGYAGLDESAWNSIGSPSDEIFPCCGIQFGYPDAAGGDLARRHEVYRQWRRNWARRGMPWSSPGQGPPPGWDPEVQVEQFLGHRNE